MNCSKLPTNTRKYSHRSLHKQIILTATVVTKPWREQRVIMGAVLTAVALVAVVIRAVEARWRGAVAVLRACCSLDGTLLPLYANSGHRRNSKSHARK